MNRQQFINYIKYPEQLNSDSLDQLENLVKEYPFFQTAKLLLALNFFLENNIKFNDQLKLTAAYATDRTVLKQLLNSLQRSVKADSNEKKSVSLTSPDNLKTIDVNKESQTETDTLVDLINQLKSEVDLYMIQSSDQRNSDQLAKLQNLADKLEKIIGAEIKPEILPVKKKSVKRITSTEYSLDHLEDFTEKKHKQLTNADLIDKFIKEEPKIVPKPTFFDPLDSARHSLMDNESVVSETLAEIYYKQGNLSKAIKIYKKLSLVNPQRSSYFAAQIEKIQKEIK